MAWATLDTQPHSSPFKLTPAPIAVLIRGITSASAGRYGFNAKRTLSQQLVWSFLREVPRAITEVADRLALQLLDLAWSLGRRCELRLQFR